MLQKNYTTIPQINLDATRGLNFVLYWSEWLITMFFDFSRAYLDYLHWINWFYCAGSQTFWPGMHLWSWKLESDARAKDALKSESLDQPCLSSFNNFSDACRWHCFSYEKQCHLVIISKLLSLSLQAFVNSHLKISILALSRLKVLL